MADDQEWLDDDELMALALQESSAGRHDNAIVKLKQFLSRQPQDASALYLLAAEHAEIGMFERAEQEFRMVIDRAPELFTAYLQLGQIHYLMGRVDDAAATWTALDQLGENDPLFLFKSGLLAAAANRTEEAASFLAKAKETVPEGGALKKDIIAALARLAATVETSQGPAEPTISRKSVLEDRYGSHEIRE